MWSAGMKALLLPKARSGLYVNVRLDTIRGYKNTPELAVFDMLCIHLVYGFLCDPNADEAQEPRIRIWGPDDNKGVFLVVLRTHSGNLPKSVFNLSFLIL